MSETQRMYDVVTYWPNGTTGEAREVDESRLRVELGTFAARAWRLYPHGAPAMIEVRRVSTGGHGVYPALLADAADAYPGEPPSVAERMARALAIQPERYRREDFRSDEHYRAAVAYQRKYRPELYAGEVS